MPFFIVEITYMKNLRFLLLGASFTLAMSSCGIFSKNKYGCKSNGKNVGAETLLSNPPKKTPKFKA
jgi:hypothetical protein